MKSSPSKLTQTFLFVAISGACLISSCAKDQPTPQAAAPAADPAKSAGAPAQPPTAKTPPVPTAPPGNPPPSTAKSTPAANPPGATSAAASPTPAPKQSPAGNGKPVSPIAPPTHAPVDPAKNNLPTSYYKAAVWSSAHSPHAAWTEAAMTSIRTVSTSLQSASDIGDFCPNYQKANRRHREICWLRLVSAIAVLESGLKTDMIFHEPKTGVISIGLMQVSQTECMVKNKPINLLDPVNNIKCAVGIMARLIRTDGFIDGPIWKRGAATYWSTLRPPYEFFGLSLGKRSEVISFTETYMKY